MNPQKVAQNFRTEVLAELASEKATIKNDSSERLPKKLPGKTVDRNVRTEILAERAFEKLSRKITYWNSVCPKLYPQNQLFKMSVPKC